MTSIPRMLGVALVVVSAGAGGQDSRFDAKALARYDVSYAQCEARFANMKGHRDEAYMSLWRIKPGDKPAARLADARGSAPYKAEKQRARQAAAVAAKSPDEQKKLDRQCRGLWGDYERAPKPQQ